VPYWHGSLGCRPHRFGRSRIESAPPAAWTVETAPSWHVPLPVLSGPTLEAASGRLPSIWGGSRALAAAAGVLGVRMGGSPIPTPASLAATTNRSATHPRFRAGLRLGPDPAAQRRRCDEEARDEDFLVGDVLEADRADQFVALLAQPQLLPAPLQRRERLVRRRQLWVADQLRLDRVRGVLDLQHPGAERGVAEVGPMPGSTCGDRRPRGRSAR
jgi:hypothetical protein